MNSTHVSAIREITKKTKANGIECSDLEADREYARNEGDVEAALRALGVEEVSEEPHASHVEASRPGVDGAAYGLVDPSDSVDDEDWACVIA